MKHEKNKKTDTPQALEVLPERLPNLIKEIPRWVCWRYEFLNGKWSKPPINPKTGVIASLNDEKVFADFEEATTAHHKESITSDGIGFVLSENDDIVGLDIDHCFEDGEITNVAQSIITRFNSYTEVSPSGEGIRIFCRGHFPFTGRKNPKHGLEIYSSGRYLTVTGHTYGVGLFEIAESQTSLEWLKEQYLEASPSSTAINLNNPDQGIDEPEVNEFINKIRLKSVGNKFQCLFRGDTDQYMSQSEADIALCGLLAKYTKNPSMIDGVFRKSALMRDKWDQVHSSEGLTYGEMTISKALNNEILYSAHKDPKYYLRNQERGDAELIKDLFQDRIIYNHYAKSWCIFENGVWNLDEKLETRKKICLALNDFYNRAANKADANVSKKHENLALDEASPKQVKKESSPEEVFRDECRNRVRNLNTRKYINNVLELAKSYLATTTNEFDKHPLLINVRNGTFDLSTNEFREHEPKELISKQCPTLYDKHAECPKWKEFLDTIFKGGQDLIHYLQQLVGYSFTGLADLDVLLYCYGGGANGKSTFVKTLQELGGDYIVSIPIDVFLLKNRDNTDQYQLSRLKGSRMVFTDEIPSGKTLNESQVKSLTGGDSINARNPHEKPFSFEPTHTLWCFGNHKLNIRGNDTGIWRRVHLIPFTHTFAEEHRRDKEPSAC